MSNYFDNIKNMKILSNNEINNLFVDYLAFQDKQAREKIINSTLRLVLKIANEYRPYGKFDDIFQEGNIGLLKAIDKFNLNYGVPWSHYAAQWIRAYIRKFVFNHQTLVKRGTTKRERKYYWKLRRELAKLQAQGLPCDYDTLGRKFHLTAEQVEMILSRSLKDKSLSFDEKFDGEENDNEVVDCSTIEYESLIVDQLAIDNIKMKYSKFIDSLTPQRKMIFEKRFLSETPETLEEIGKKLGVTRARIQQIQTEIGKDFKNALETDSL